MSDADSSSGPEEWPWLSRRLIEVLHAESLSRFGGSPGLRDEGLLESALARPRQQARYEEPTAFELAATYADALIRGHAFVDGNKRVGLLAARVFLFRTGYRLEPEEAETVAVVERVAAGDVRREALARWLKACSTELEDTGST